MIDKPGDLDAMSPEHKRQLLAELLQDSSRSAPSNLALEQRRQWLLRKLDDRVPWHVHVAAEITGPLDLAALQQALSDHVRRQDALRMVFVEVGGRPMRTTAPAAALRLPVVDLPADAPEEELRRVVAREVTAPFDVGTGPLVRVCLVRRDAERHVLVLTAHRLVADDSSLRRLLDDVLDTCAALEADTGGEVEPPAASYADAVARQQEWLAGPEAAADVEFWRRHLDGLHTLDVPADRPRPALKTFAGAATSVEVDPGTAERLTTFARRIGTPLSTVLLAAWAAVLSRHSAQQDLAVGVTLPGRRDDDLADVVGPFENAVPVRLDLTTDPSFGDLVAATGRALVEVERHGGLPFERIVEEVQPVRDLSHMPLFQVSYDYRDAAAATLRHDRARLLEVEVGWVVDDLQLRVRETPGGLVLTLRYNTDLYGEDTARRLLQHVLILAAEAAGEPTTPVSRLPLMTAEEHAQVVRGWNRSLEADRDPRCLHQLVEDSARRDPTARAVVAGDRELTYGQLNGRANAVAAELIALGRGVEDRVGVLVDRSADAVVGLLGVVKSGAAYVPVDPTYPADRLRHVLDDAGVTTVVGTPAAIDLLPDEVRPAHVVEIPAHDRAEPLPNPAVPVTPANLAYVIYTSGSTGRPKGVAVEHRQIVASTVARTATEGAGRPERYLVLAPLTFDASGGGLYWTLNRGGTVVLPTEAEVYDPRLLGKLIRTHGITHVDGVPSQYSVLLETDPAARPSVRGVILAGEAMPPATVAEHHKHHPDAVLYNEYGPTEATVWATVHRVPPSAAESSSVPIGRPVPGAAVYLLDEHLNPVPAGIAGELYIGGAGVARGYRGQPGRTAERFLPDPFSGVPGARLYRTGDRARHLPDGTVEFLGRTDTQVKVRGFRIELSEVENVLMRHPAVTEAVVTVREDQPGVSRLVGYVVPSVGRVLTQEALSAHCVQQLPDYMVPQAFVSLEKMPLTPHGKIDRDALPAPDSAGGGAHVEPRTQLEADIAETFAAVLGVSRVSATASFFDLGGDSLLVARLVARLSRDHDIELPVDEIFRVPTVEGIARTVAAALRKRDGKLDNAALFAQQAAELKAEVKLDPDIRPDGLPRADHTDPRDVLVTGATGYLGAFLVVELMKRTRATVHCLVRGESQQAAEERLENVLRGYRAWDESFRPRLRVVVGDLAKSALGLAKEEWDRLAREVDAIYHSGAIVNFTFPYEAMRAANVHGTEELLRLACRHKLKAFHHVSSVDVFLGAGAERPFHEGDLPEVPKAIPSGYPRTKWVSEKLVALARDRGVPVTVFRPWMVIGHRETGAAHSTDYLFVYLKGFLDLGVLPFYNDIVNAIPVDYTAEAIVHVSLRPDCTGRNYNITNPHPATMGDAYRWLRTFGYDLNVVDDEVARQKALSVDQDHVLFPLTPIIRTASLKHAALDPELQSKIDSREECRNLLEALEGSGITCPPMTEEMAHASFRFLVETGYLPAPEKFAPEKLAPATSAR